MESFILVYGNPIDGLSFVGPFADAEDANNYGDIHHGHDDWWVVALQPKEIIHTEQRQAQQ